jgi:hypothetical protein
MDCVLRKVWNEILYNLLPNFLFSVLKDLHEARVKEGTRNNFQTRNYALIYLRLHGKPEFYSMLVNVRIQLAISEWENITLLY